MVKPDYYEEPKKNARGMEVEGSSDYSKWRVEDALRTLQEAQKILSDKKMVVYVRKCLAFQAAQNAEVAAQLSVETKVGKKLKEVFSG